MGDEAAATEYYWDEDTQTYYYWDEATQAYYPWTEEEQQPAVTAEEPQERPPEPSSPAPPVEVPKEPTAAEAPKEPSPPPAPPSEPEPPQGAEFYQRGGVRSSTRRLSFAQHGGLAGVLQIVSAERASRKATVQLTDEEIKAAQQRERVREMLEHAGVVKAESHGPPQPPQLEEQAAAAPTEREDESARRMFQNVDRQQQPYRRHSTVRFGTSEFGDPAFQSRLEAMLGTTVRKKG